jgi:hypothetical protein
VNKPKVGVLYSRVRVEEKLLFEAFEKRGVSLDLLDDQKLIFDITDVDNHPYKTTTSSSSAASITAARSTA